MSTRKTLVLVHRWLGLSIGLLWALQALTGTLLVFHRELQHAVASLPEGPMASLDVIAANANAMAHRTVERIRLFDGYGDKLGADYVDAGGKPQILLLQAATGAVYDTIERAPRLPGHGTIWRWIYNLHHSLLAHTAGEMVIGSSGLFLLLTLILGLWVGWPPRRAWRITFQPRRWRSLLQKLYGWHRATGLVAAFTLMLIALSGTFMIFESEIRSFLAAHTDHRLKYRADPVATMPPITVSPQRAYDIAQRHFPNARFESIALPSPTTPAYVIRLTQAGEPRAWAGVTVVVVDPTSGATLYSYDALRAPLSNRIADAAYAMHSGEIVGVPGKLLALLSGLSLFALSVTGVWLWLRRRS